MHSQVGELVDEGLAVGDEPGARLARVLVHAFSPPQAAEVEEGVEIQLLVLELGDDNLGLHQAVLRLVHQQGDGLCGGFLDLLAAHPPRTALGHAQANEARDVVSNGVGEVALLDQAHRRVGVLQFDMALERLPVPPVRLVQLGQAFHDDPPVAADLAVLDAVFAHVPVLELVP